MPANKHPNIAAIDNPSDGGTGGDAGKWTLALGRTLTKPTPEIVSTVTADFPFGVTEVGLNDAVLPAG